MKYKKKGSYDILKDTSENFILVQLMDYLGNLNHDISVVGCWMFESNYKTALVLNREPLDIICAPSVGEEKAAEFETLFPAVKYICFDARLNKDYL